MGSLCFETEVITLCCVSCWYCVKLLVSCLFTTVVVYLKVSNDPLQQDFSFEQDDLPRNKFGNDIWGRESEEGLLVKQASLWRCARASSDNISGQQRQVCTNTSACNTEIHAHARCLLCHTSLQKSQGLCEKWLFPAAIFWSVRLPLVFESIPHQCLNRNTLTIMFKVTDF